jgi:2-methylcitrate synthase/citrate synthase II
MTTGLDGIIAGQTAICSLEGQLRYRGYSIEDLAENSTFEDVAYLLLFGELPRDNDRQNFSQKLGALSCLSTDIQDISRNLPSTTHPMEALRTVISLLGGEEFAKGGDLKTQREKAMGLLAKIPLIVSTRSNRPGESYAENESFAWNLLRALTFKNPTDLEARVFDVTLILYAEHEFNASTFAARLTASTLSDYYSAIVSAVGTLKGPLHGGANEAVMAMLQAIQKPENAEGWIHQALAQGEKIMGFGHRVYKHGDPRAPILRRWAEKLGDTKWLEVADRVQEIIWKEKKLLPNADFPSAVIYFTLGIPQEWYTPIFAASRLTGWSAHIFEQWQNNRLIRPRADYTGPAPRALGKT